MRNIKIEMMYDGSGYAGWQRLGVKDKKPSIQATIEECISDYLNENIKITGAGRTDAGTHALGQVANFYCKSGISAEEMKRGLNHILPEDIVFIQAEDADMNFHSRHSALYKTYEYRIDQGEMQSVFTRKYTYHVPGALQIEDMLKASDYLIGTHDFKAFSTDRKDNKSTVRTLKSIEIRQVGNELRMTFTGDGFLYNMVRIIVGTLLEVGEGKISPEDMGIILDCKNRQAAGMTVSSQGLFLKKVYYK